MSGRFGYILAAAAILLLQSCIFNKAGMRSRGLGNWPPTSTQCVRKNNVPFELMGVSIGGELTRLFADPACVTQPTCAGWVAQENRALSGPVSGHFWMGSSNHQFTLSEQDSIGADARAAATAQTPPNKRLLRLTIMQGIVTGGPSTGVVQATAHYGQCIADITDTKRGGRAKD